MSATTTDPMVATPTPDHADAAHLYAWYGPFGIAQDYRKVVLSGCSEAIRAQSVGEKISEARISDLAHTHDAYLAFLERTLLGRIAFEREAAKRGFGG